MNKNILWSIVVIVLIVIAGVFMWNRSNDVDVATDTDTDLVDTGATTSPTTTDGSNATKPATKPATSAGTTQTSGNIVVVTYTDQGFSPFIAEVKVGSTVKFVNNSSKALWVTSYQHPTATTQSYPGFDEGKSISKGQSYLFTFNTKGVWGYKNLNNAAHLGAVAVTQ